MRIYGARVVGTCEDLPELVKDMMWDDLLADHRMTYRDYRSITKACDAISAKSFLFRISLVIGRSGRGITVAPPMEGNGVRRLNFVSTLPG